jgi:hypothetical protein
MALFESYTYSTAASFTHTGGSMEKMILLVGCRINDTGSGVYGMTYNGAAMTLLYSQEITGRYFYLYYMLNPPPGAFTVAISGGGASGRETIAASFGQVDSEDPWQDPPTTHSGTSDASCSLTPTSEAHDLTTSWMLGTTIALATGIDIYTGTKLGVAYNWPDLATAWTCDSGSVHTQVQVVLNGVGTNTVSAAISPFYRF